MVRNRPIFLDYHSTTPVDPRVLRRIIPYMNDSFGNASSLEHQYGSEVQVAVADAKREIAKLLGCLPKEIVFTSGATESINLAIQGVVQRAILMSDSKKPELAVSPIEHKAVLETCFYLEKRGLASVTLLEVDQDGRIDFQYLDQVCSKQPALLCVMAANNEIGTIQDVVEIGQIAKQFDVPFFCDASQAVGKFDLHFHEAQMSLMAFTSHKIYGPKGIGALVIKDGFTLEPLFFGGGHQGGIRPGTLNVAGIVGLGEACKLRNDEMMVDEQQIERKRDWLATELLSQIPDLKWNGDRLNRLAGNLNISIPGVRSGEILSSIRSNLAISTGSACSSGTSTSHVLKAIGLSDDLIQSSLRIGIGKFTTDEEIGIASRVLVHAIQKVRNSRYLPT